MGFFSTLFGTKKMVDTATNVIDGAVAGVDKLFFTEEEKAEFRQKIGEYALEVMRTTAGESTARSITRRIIAVTVVGTYLALLVFAVGIYRIDDNWASTALAAANTLSTEVTAISIFYFGYYAVNNVIRAWKKPDKKESG